MKKSCLPHTRLYLTSHGAKDATLTVQQAGLGLKDVTAADIKTALDESGIDWRIIIMSACYSARSSIR